MTDWHCERCRRHVRLYRHSRGLPCPSCAAVMRRGVGRRTTRDPHYEALTAARQHDELEAQQGRRR